MTLVNKAVCVWESTGEFRCPRKDEWFLSPYGYGVMHAFRDFSIIRRAIMRPVLATEPQEKGWVN